MVTVGYYKETTLRIGLDIHGVIQERQPFFKELCSMFVGNGHEVHIITGPTIEKARRELYEMGFAQHMHFTHLFSITSHHESIGSTITYDNEGNPFMEEYLWDKTKAEYCIKNKIDLHLDDTDSYGYFFKTPFARFYSKNKRPHYIPK